MKTIKIIKYVYMGLISLIILILALFLLSSLFSKKGYSEVFGISLFEVQSYSMYPELDKGDLVVVKKRAADKYEVGMTVTYIRPGEKIPTTHKIVKIEGNIITTRGVNTETNNSDDIPFDVSYIIGEVVTVWRNFNQTREFVTSPIGIIVILLWGFLFIEGFKYLEEVVREKRIKKLKEELGITDNKE